MKPWVPVLCVAVLLPLTPGFAAAAADALAPGSWSAQFSVQPNFTLGSFQGSVLSLKRHLASGRAVRVGFSFSMRDQSADQARTVDDSLFSSNDTNGDDSSGWSIGVNASYLWYSSAAAPIHAYWGGGPFANVLGTADDQVSAFGNNVGGSGTRAFHADGSGWQAGLAGTLGVEWLAAKRVSLFAEYGVSFGYTSFSETRETVESFPFTPTRTTVSTFDSQRIQFGGTGALLGVSAYF